jgi:hypothetical protein
VTSARWLSLTLKALAPLFVVVGLLHVVLGLNADIALGARLPAAAIVDPALDSQNRFYGVAFTLYGVLLWVCAADLRKYAVILRCVLWVFFAAGLARLVSIVTHGLPPPTIINLLATELIAPPVLVWLLAIALKEEP